MAQVCCVLKKYVKFCGPVTVSCHNTTEELGCFVQCLNAVHQDISFALNAQRVSARSYFVVSVPCGFVDCIVHVIPWVHQRCCAALSVHYFKSVQLLLLVAVDTLPRAYHLALASRLLLVFSGNMSCCIDKQQLTQPTPEIAEGKIAMANQQLA